MTAFRLNPYHKSRHVHQMYAVERVGPYPRRAYLGSYKTAERADIAGRLALYWLNNGYATADTVPRGIRNPRKRVDPWLYDLDAAVYEAQRRWATTGKHHCVVQLGGGRLGVRAFSKNFRAAWTTHDTQRQLGVTNNSGARKLEPGDATLIRELRAGGMTLAAIADKFDVVIGTILAVVQGRTWCDDRS